MNTVVSMFSMGKELLRFYDFLDNSWQNFLSFAYLQKIDN